MSERSKLQFFVKQTSNCVTDCDRKLYHCSSKSPWLNGNIFITSWENTAANGTLVLSLTCMIFLYEECIGSAFTVLYFRWMMLFYVPVKLKLKHPSPGNSPGKFLFKFPPPEAEKLFKCPIIGPFQVIKCSPPPGNFSVASIMLRKLCM